MTELCCGVAWWVPERFAEMHSSHRSMYAFQVSGVRCYRVRMNVFAYQVGLGYGGRACGRKRECWRAVARTQRRRRTRACTGCKIRFHRYVSVFS